MSDGIKWSNTQISEWAQNLHYSAPFIGFLIFWLNDTFFVSISFSMKIIEKNSIQMEFNTRSLQIVHGSMEKIEKSNSINVLERHNVWATCSQYVVRINECNWNSEVHFCGYAVSSFCLSVRLIFILYKSTDFITHLLFVHFHLFLFQIFYHSTKWNTFKMTSHEHSECPLSKNSCWEIWALNFANNSIRILLLLENLIWSFIQLCRIGWMNLIESCIKAEFGHRFGLLNLKQVKS